MMAGWGAWKVQPKGKGKFSYESPDKLQLLSTSIMKQEKCKKQFQLNLKPNMVPKSIFCTVPLLSSSGCKVNQYFYLI